MLHKQGAAQWQPRQAVIVLPLAQSLDKDTTEQHSPVSTLCTVSAKCKLANTLLPSARAGTSGVTSAHVKENKKSHGSPLAIFPLLHACFSCCFSRLPLRALLYVLLGVTATKP